MGEDNAIAIASHLANQKALEKEITRLQAAARAASVPIALSLPTINLLETIRNRPEKVWQRLDYSEKRMAANALLSRVLVAVEPRPRGFGTGYRREVESVSRRDLSV
jgi:hypothetical protein